MTCIPGFPRYRPLCDEPAVTHVFLSDPKRGYGISIRDMLDDAGVLDEAA